MRQWYLSLRMTGVWSSGWISIQAADMFRASMCPSSGKNCCTYATLVFVTLCGWRLVCWLDLNPTKRPDATHTE